MNGVINLIKPRGMTSHDLVNISRKILKTKKIGHTGTLDPNASGVLPICVGKATRIAEYLLELDKEYIAELTLGIRTDTQDMDGKLVSSSTIDVSEDDIIRVMSKYKGSLKQLPPMYSSLKHNGRKLYEYAREGKTIEREKRDIIIYDQNIIKIEENKEILFYIKCSKGTYIRTICDDIGMDLGTYGYMSYLLRISAGNFKIENSYSVDYLKTLDTDEIKKIIIPMDVALQDLGEYFVDDELYSKLINGVRLPANQEFQNEVNKPLRIYCKNIFIGIGKIILEDENYYLKMDKVLTI